LIFQVGSEVFTHKPRADGGSGVGEDEGENYDTSIDEKTPRRRDFQHSNANTNEGPYETPVILRTKPWVPPVADDTEADDSEIERDAIMKRKKGKRTKVG
jgi:hypothetical protein